MELVERYAGPGPGDGARERSASRRRSASALEFVERDRVTWDHRKLGGTY